MPDDGYELLDSGDGRKLERFGPYRIVRPCAQAVWRPRKGRSLWNGAHASFGRQPDAGWQNRSALPETWAITLGGLRFILSATDSGQVGVFPEQRALWPWLPGQA